MTLRPIPNAAVSFLQRHEELVLRVYDDAQPSVLMPAQTKGTLTAGYGHTGDLVLGQNVTHEDADSWLQDDDLPLARTRLYNAAGDEAIDELTDNQYAALLSFVFNLGANPGWTIWKRLKDKQFDQVPLEMMKFVNARQGGVLVKVQGLVNRRAAEVALWSKDEPGSVPDAPPSSVTRAVETPPTPADPVPASKSKTVIAAAAAAVTGAPSAISGVTKAMQPYADNSDLVQHVIGILALVAALCAGAAVVFMYLHKQKARN